MNLTCLGQGVLHSFCLDTHITTHQNPFKFVLRERFLTDSEKQTP